MSVHPKGLDQKREVVVVARSPAGNYGYSLMKRWNSMRLGKGVEVDGASQQAVAETQG